MGHEVHMLQSSTESQMMSFIIKTEDEKLIIVDGGLKEDANKLIEYLYELTGGKKPLINAWFLTHAHRDHIGAFLDIIVNRHFDVDIAKVNYNFPSIRFFKNFESKRANEAEHFYRLLPFFADKLEIVSAFDKYKIGEADIEVLHSPEPDITINTFNNSSIVFRVTLAETSILFTGDLGKEGGCKLLNRWGNNLKSDMCQMAHHGQQGVSKEVYEAINPEICLWCTPEWLWENNAGKGFDSHIWKTVEVRKWMDEIGVKKHYVTKDGPHVIRI